MNTGLDFQELPFHSLYPFYWQKLFCRSCCPCIRKIGHISQYFTCKVAFLVHYCLYMLTLEKNYLCSWPWSSRTWTDGWMIMTWIFIFMLTILSYIYIYFIKYSVLNHLINCLKFTLTLPLKSGWVKIFSDWKRQDRNAYNFAEVHRGK